MKYPKNLLSLRILVWCIFSYSGLLFGQSSFQRFSTNDGLAQNNVTSIVQDQQGFLWFGTYDGLSRYDGYTFTTYHSDPKDSGSLAPGFITSLYVASNGMLWVGFRNGSIDLFDPSTERFHHLLEPSNRTQQIYTPMITSIAEDDDNVVWIGTRADGLLRAQRSGASIHEYRLTRSMTMSADGTNINTEFVGALFTDRDGTLWCKFGEMIAGLDRRTQPARLIGKRNLPRTEDIASYTFNQDSSGRVWLLGGVGLSWYDAATDTWHAVPSAFRKDMVDEQHRLSSSLTGEDQFGMMWGCVGRRFFQFRPSDPSSIIPVPEPRSETNHVLLLQYLFAAPGGSIWIGTNGFGAYRFDRKKAAFGIIRSRTYSSILDTFRILPLPAEPALATLPSLFGQIYQSHTFRDRTGILWSEGINRTPAFYIRAFDPRTRSMMSYSTGFGPGQVQNAYNSRFLEDRSGNLWIIHSSAGLDLFERGSKTFTHFQIIGDSLVAVNRYERDIPEFTTAVIDPNGIFWIGTTSIGLIRFNPADRSVKRYSTRRGDTLSISSNHVLTICPDPHAPDRYLWIGTNGGGLNKMDILNGTFTSYSTRTGLPSNLIYGVMSDRQKNLWMSTNYGIWKLETRSMRFQIYDLNDGLQGMEYNRNEFLTAMDGKMIFGGTDGMNAFYPEQITENKYIPPVVFTDLKLKNRSVTQTDPASPLKVSLSATKDITLPYDENIITLEFSALDYSNPAKNNYSYRLLGFDDDWSIPSTRRSATYTNLDPGEYIFTVKASNDDGAWNDIGASLTLTIVPPWYRTWYAYTTYIIAIAMLLFLVRRYELKRLRMKDDLIIERSRSEQLKEVDQMKMRFFQNISHEFRTPLTLILGPVEKLLSRATDEMDKRDLRIMRRNAQRLVRLINQLLDISKLEAGEMHLTVVQSDIVSFIRGVTMSFHSLAEHKEIFLDVHAEPPEIFMYFDQEKLEKILVNLLGNAFKFTPENGEVKVNIAIRRDVHTREEWVDIIVRDTGIGIPQDKVRHVFNRFYQADSSTTRSHEGTGIGLSLVKELVERHKGTIAVSSTMGKGSSFIISLPLGMEHLSPNEYQIGTEVTRDQKIPLQESMTIENEIESSGGEGVHHLDENHPLLLVIEDNVDVREYIKSYLNSQYRVIEAFDGIQGIMKAREHVPDLIISDIMMPNKDGYEVCQAIKKDEATSHIPVILLTAKAAREDKISGLETGADDYLIKPFDSHELLIRIKNLIDNRKRLREKFGLEVVTLKPEEITVVPAEQAFVSKVKRLIEQNMGNENFDVEQLAGALNMSYTQLHRKLKAVTNQTANQFIRSMRLHRAMDIIRQNGQTIAETAYSVGFSSPAYFTKCFTEQFSISPSEIRNQQSSAGSQK